MTTVSPPRRSTALIGDDNRIVVGGRTLTLRTLHKLPQLPSPAAVLVDNGADALAAVRHHAVHGTESTRGPLPAPAAGRASAVG